MDLGLSVRTQPVRPIPQPSYAPGAKPSRAPGPLLGGVQRDALALQRIDAAIRIERGLKQAQA